MDGKGVIMNTFIRKVYMTGFSCIVLCVSSAYYLSNGSMSILNQPISTTISTIQNVSGGAKDCVFDLQWYTED